MHLHARQTEVSRREVTEDGSEDFTTFPGRGHLCVEAGKRVGLVKLTVPLGSRKGEGDL